MKKGVNHISFDKQFKMIFPLFPCCVHGMLSLMVMRSKDEMLSDFKQCR